MKATDFAHLSYMVGIRMRRGIKIAMNYPVPFYEYCIDIADFLLFSIKEIYREIG